MFSYPAETGRAINTAKTGESLRMTLRKVSKNRVLYKREGAEPAIDTFRPERPTPSGGYLFVVSPAPTPGEYSVKFKVTN